MVVDLVIDDFEIEFVTKDNFKYLFHLQKLINQHYFELEHHKGDLHIVIIPGNHDNNTIDPDNTRSFEIGMCTCAGYYTYWNHLEDDSLENGLFHCTRKFRYEVTASISDMVTEKIKIV